MTDTQISHTFYDEYEPDDPDDPGDLVVLCDDCTEDGRESKMVLSRRVHSSGTFRHGRGA